MAQDITFYWGSGSPHCWRVMLVLEAKALKGYKSELLSFEKKEHKSPVIMALNPRGQLPVLKVGNLVICESLASMDFLETKFKGQGIKLLPDDPNEKAKVLQRQFEVLAFQKKAVEDYMGVIRSGNPNKLSEETIAERKKAFLDELTIWDAYVKATGSFIAGKSFTMADAYFFPLLALIVRCQANLKKAYPSLHSYHERMKDHAAVKASWPPHWADGPGPEMLKSLC